MIKKLIIPIILCAILFFSCAKKEEEDVYSLPPDDGRTVIVIDPGHGFDDVGCIFDGGYEKDLNLELALALRDSFETAGASVILTHDGKDFPSAGEITENAEKYAVMFNPEWIDSNSLFGKYERAVWENILDRKESVDLFISIHANSIENKPEMTGASIDYCTVNPYSDMLSHFSKVLSEKLTGDGISDSLRIFADTPEDAYVVTKFSTAPSVLIEAGYTTNKEELERMQDSDWQKKFADAVSFCAMETLGK